MRDEGQDGEHETGQKTPARFWFSQTISLRTGLLNSVTRWSQLSTDPPANRTPRHNRLRGWSPDWAGHCRFRDRPGASDRVGPVHEKELLTPGSRRKDEPSPGYRRSVCPAFCALPGEFVEEWPPSYPVPG